MKQPRGVNFTLRRMTLVGVVGLALGGIVLLGGLRPRSAFVSTAQDSFRRDSHVCEAKYANEEVQRLCIELDLHKDDSARLAALLYGHMRAEAAGRQEIKPRRP